MKIHRHREQTVARLEEFDRESLAAVRFQKALGFFRQLELEEAATANASVSRLIHQHHRQHHQMIQVTTTVSEISTTTTTTTTSKTTTSTTLKLIGAPSDDRNRGHVKRLSLVLAEENSMIPSTAKTTQPWYKRFSAMPSPRARTLTRPWTSLNRRKEEPTPVVAASALVVSAPRGKFKKSATCPTES